MRWFGKIQADGIQRRHSFFLNPLSSAEASGAVSYSGTLESGNAYSFNLTLKNTNSLGTRSAGTSDCELELVEVRDMYEE